MSNESGDVFWEESLIMQRECIKDYAHSHHISDDAAGAELARNGFFEAFRQFCESDVGMWMLASHVMAPSWMGKMETEAVERFLFPKYFV